MKHSALSYDEYVECKHFSSMDGIRAVSALMVISWHLHPHGWLWFSGYSGVSIFFVLSGYLITTLALREESKRGEVSLKAFYVRRTFRIFPVYYIVLCGYCLLICVADIQSFRTRQDVFWEALPCYLTYMGEYIPSGDAPFSIAWSLGIEEKFYLLWPLIGFVLCKRSLRGRVGFLTLVLVVSYLLELGSAPDILRLASYSKIALGCLIAVCLNERELFERLRVCGTTVCISLSLVALLSLQLSLNAHPGLLSLYSCVVGLFLIGVLTGHSIIGTFLSSSALGYIGRRSYSIYLIHTLAINAVDIVLRFAHINYVPSPIYFVVAALCSIGLAEGLYRAIESPGISVGRKLSSRILAVSPISSRAEPSSVALR